VIVRVVGIGMPSLFKLSFSIYIDDSLDKTLDIHFISNPTEHSHTSFSGHVNIIDLTINEHIELV